MQGSPAQHAVVLHTKVKLGPCLEQKKICSSTLKAQLQLTVEVDHAPPKTHTHAHCKG